MPKINKSTIENINENPQEYAESLDINKLVLLLKKLSNEYYNTGKSIISDTSYDILKESLEERDPTNPFLKVVGSHLPKGTKKKETLPYPMGSLNKIKPDEKTLDKWMSNYSKGPYVISDKLDGVSGQLYKDQNGKMFLYTRGNGTVGQNISHLINFVMKDIDLEKIPNGSSIRGELIINKKDFVKIKDVMKNARNAVAGLVNSKTVDLQIAQLTQFVAYSILNPRIKYAKQFKTLTQWNFKVVDNIILKQIDENILKKILIEHKAKSEFEIDGIVCADDSQIYENEEGYPTHMFAFKMIDVNQIEIATVVKVIWNPSMDGYLKPVIEIKPVEFAGSTVTYATAFNAKYIVDNVIGAGAKIKIIKSGDVIPYILEVIKPAITGKPSMPDMSYKWNNTKVDIVLSGTNAKTNKDVIIKLLIHFFKTMNVKFLSEGIITKLVENNYTSIAKILSADHKDLVEIDGIGEKMVDKIFEEINNSFKTVKLHTFMAACHIFGRGMGERKIKEITKIYPNILTHKWSKQEFTEKILDIKGFSDITTNLFVDNFDEFLKFFNEINKIIDISRFKTVENNKKNANKKNHFEDKTIVFTGFRDNNLEKIIETLGGKVSTSVSSKTFLVVYNGEEDSSKMKKAKTLNIDTLKKEEFIKKYKLENINTATF